ncbi:40S ribosomal protein S6 [Cavenderia fasciculata]|uniref:40S ribosomal protein S6 n=1 Tax=Cavenderia fasciculata TaxID=261658 RepID=F4Q9M4_CACFS|nr:40S ribosomal protein S6 [Cavenderia fasciculata]EGG15393.1 40S ribosomal protein S6 [Cavenderia fasciculata]|eukprot:XP_004354135.1 40S ribosomal protein S6 [Cavenderia fasciculata]
MKLNISNPSTGAQKCINIEDKLRYRCFIDKRMGQEVSADSLGDEYKGYIFKISGGNDADGFPMMQGVAVPHRVRLLLNGTTGSFIPKRDGERRRKSVRGCIVAEDISALQLVIVKKGDAELPGLTDVSIPLRKGPKRAGNIRKLFNLSKEDDVRKYVIRRELPATDKRKAKSKAPKIQRLITPVVIKRRKALRAKKLARMVKASSEAAEYKKLIDSRSEAAKSKRSTRKSSVKVVPAAKTAAPAKAAQKK